MSLPHPLPSFSLTPEYIQAWCGLDAFLKGKSYFQHELIHQTRRDGQHLYAQCHGLRGVPYEMSATLSRDGITQAGCTCPEGEEARCPHVAALLLAWLEAPETFGTVDMLQTMLEKRSKPELVALMRMMLERDPELKILLDMPLPSLEAPGQSIDWNAIRKQVQHAFRSDNEWGWPDPKRVTSDLHQLFNLAEQYGTQKQDQNAAFVYEEILAATLNHPDAILNDEPGRYGRILWQATQGLGSILPEIDDPGSREAALKALFDLLAWDTIQAGGIGVSDGVPDIFLEQAAPDEVQQIVQWIEGILPNGDRWQEKYERQRLGGLLLTLQEQSLDDEAFIDLCRQTGRLGNLVDRLLSLGRYEEAMQDTHTASDFELIELANIFVQHERGELGRALLEERATTSKDTRLHDWLKNYARKQGNLLEALKQAVQVHAMRPTVETYAEIHDLAEPLERWQALRSGLLEHLAKTNQHTLLTEIYLYEGQVSLALAALEKGRAVRYFMSEALVVQVAEAARAELPREAIRLYLELANRLIDGRGRDNYIQAVEYLKQVHHLYQNLGETGEWNRVIADLRLKNRSLRALKEELDRGGL
jgi:uncharacterized Zn finger protein